MVSKKKINQSYIILKKSTKLKYKMGCERDKTFRWHSFLFGDIIFCLYIVGAIKSSNPSLSV